MPPPALLGPLIVAGGQVAGSGINALATGSQNRRSREWSERMYARQFQDNVNFWRMQNEYNAPEQQMQRLKAAGLNPNLVYGGSSAGAAGQAGNIQTPDVQPVQFRTPEFGSALTALASYFDTEIKQAQAKNLEMQNTVLAEEAALKAAQTSETVARTNRSVFDLDFESELRGTSADYRREQLRKLTADTRFTLNQDERAAAMNSSNLMEAAERILKMRAETANTRLEYNRIQEAIKNLRLDSTLKQLDADLKAVGIQPHDNMMFRVLGRLMYQITRDPRNKEFIGEMFNSVFKKGGDFLNLFK